MPPGGYRQLVHRADNLTTIMCRLSRNLGASTSWNPRGLYRDRFTFSYIFVLMPITTLMVTQITGVETNV